MKRRKPKKYNFKVGDIVILNAEGQRAFSKFKGGEDRRRNLLLGTIIKKIIHEYADLSFDPDGVWLCHLKKIRSAKKIKKIRRRIIIKML